MKKLLVVLLLMFANVSFAETINVNWKVDNTTYTTSTCEAGGNLIIPQTPPTKYGYTFVGWNYGIIKGTWSRSGTPTPSNPIEPVFYQLGNTVLRALGSGENFIADEYNPSAEKITRYVGVKVLDGTETCSINSNMFKVTLSLPVEMNSGWQKRRLCSHGITAAASAANDAIEIENRVIWFGGKLVADMGWTTSADGKAWLADQYANGTPVTIYYPLAEPVEESWSLSE